MSLILPLSDIFVFDVGFASTVLAPFALGIKDVPVEVRNTEV